MFNVTSLLLKFKRIYQKKREKIFLSRKKERKNRNDFPFPKNKSEINQGMRLNASTISATWSAFMGFIPPKGTAEIVALALYSATSRRSRA